MTAHILDQPILAALTTRHKVHAQGGPHALRYAPDISPFAAAADESAEALAALGDLVPADGNTIVLRAGRQAVPPGIVADQVVEAVQMAAFKLAPLKHDFAFEELTDKDVPEMMELTTLTKPGPFRLQTLRFGGYIGIRQEGRLVAMAGQRLQVPGYTEVSAVCTHPDFRGRGFGSHLMLVVGQRIRSRGETPFLHAFAANKDAIRLYEALGFVHRSSITVTVLARP
jgi:predicted GNAT family acetyltransferase